MIPRSWDVDVLTPLVRELRRRYFAVPRGESVNLVVTGEYGQTPSGDVLDLPLITAVLAPAGFTGPWERSYHYEGEDANLVRFYYDAEAYPAHPFRQDHVRLFIEEHPPGEIGLAAHSEASALAHKDAHIDEVGYDPKLGAQRVAAVLEAAGVTFIRDLNTV